MKNNHSGNFFKRLIAYTFFLIFSIACTQQNQKLAPEFHLLHFDGKVTSLKHLRGKPFLLNFWSTFCLPCLAEIPDLNNLYDKYKDKGFIILGVALDDDHYDVKNYVESSEIHYPIVMRSNHIEIDYGVTSLPMSFFVDKKGIIQKQYKGKPNIRELEKLIEQDLLRE